MKTRMASIKRMAGYAAALICAFFLLAGSAAAQVETTVADTVHAPDGSLPSGQIVISATSTFTAADGTVVFQGTVATATVTSGAFSVGLVPNAGSSPAGTSYLATYKLAGVAYKNETWVVPASGPVTLADVRSATLSSPSALVTASQLPALTGDVTSSAGSAATSVVGWHFGATALSLGTVPSDGECFTRSGLTVTGVNCGGSSLTLSVNGTNDATQTGLNAATSTANAVGLTVTPSNPSGNDWKFEITGSSYTGNAATATALATLPTQCTGSQFATGIAANGNANCGTPAGGSPGGSSGQVQINSAGAFGGAANLTYDSTTSLTTLAAADKGGQVYNVKAYGAKGDGKSYFDGVLATGGFGSAAQFDHTGTSTTATAPSVTTTADNSLAMQVWLVPQTWSAAPATGNNRLTETLGGGMFNFTVHDENITPPGLVASVSGTISSAFKWNASTIFAAPTAGHAISFVSVSDNQQASGATITVTAPAGLATGQVVIGCVGYSHSSSNVISSAPSGMTLLFSSTDPNGFGSINCYYQVVGTPPASYSWTESPMTSFGMSAFAAAYTNIDTGGLTFSSASAPFSASQVGDPICVAGIGASGAQICGTIASFVSSSQVGLSSSFDSGSAGTGLWFNFGTNDDSAFSSAITAAQATPGGIVYAPCGNYVLTQALSIAPNKPIRILGCAPGASNTESNYLNSYSPYNLNVGTVLQFDTASLATGAVSFKAGSFTTNFASGYSLENLTVYGGAGKARDGGGNDGVDIIAFPWVTLKNVFVANFSGIGVYIDYLGNAAGQGWITNVSLDRVFSFWNGGYGVKVGSTFTGHRLENISIDG
ncbi:MAG TPA: hypothetical protein VFZ27_17425, partial [Terriglobia bacterium]|nr:hypothetical protein [Terriglobia bacterium]